mmetsp:Transcript_18308/g.55100  ORF Transcript_18308/g.55100 Transcript_18308/m.55100 type:complete len:387 (+) Transcript_18308:1237-2397(+)
MASTSYGRLPPCLSCRRAAGALEAEPEDRPSSGVLTTAGTCSLCGPLGDGVAGASPLPSAAGVAATAAIAADARERWWSKELPLGGLMMSSAKDTRRLGVAPDARLLFLRRSISASRTMDGVRGIRLALPSARAQAVRRSAASAAACWVCRLSTMRPPTAIAATDSTANATAGVRSCCCSGAMSPPDTTWKVTALVHDCSMNIKASWSRHSVRLLRPLVRSAIWVRARRPPGSCLRNSSQSAALLKPSIASAPSGAAAECICNGCGCDAAFKSLLSWSAAATHSSCSDSWSTVKPSAGPLVSDGTSCRHLLPGEAAVSPFSCAAVLSVAHCSAVPRGEGLPVMTAPSPIAATFDRQRGQLREGLVSLEQLFHAVRAPAIARDVLHT